MQESHKRSTTDSLDHRIVYPESRYIPDAEIKIDLSRVKNFIDKSAGFKESLNGEEHKWVYKDLTKLYLYHPESFFHSTRVAGIYGALAGLHDFPKDQIHLMVRAGLTHDLGKLDVPYTILNKPGPLTEVETNGMQYHMFGSVARLAAHNDDAVANIVAGHHLYHPPEFDDIDDETLLLQHHLLRLADETDVVMSPRIYRKPVSPEEAVVDLMKSRSTTRQVVEYAVSVRKGMDFLRTLP